MRNISFAITTEQVRSRTKTVTRRLGWVNLKEGEILQGVEKCQGLKKGEKIQPLCKIQVILVDREPLDDIIREDVIKEGFPEMTCEQFIKMFCKSHKGCTPSTIITRIEFEYV